MAVLACYAASDETSRGRKYQEAAPAHRNQYQRDRDRIIHCAAFRRLEYKTQVFVNHEGDMFRTRLTHSIEVAQIGRTIARALSLNEDLTEAICLAHDLGHTPFGHAGQDALNTCMKDYGGFEHNLQSLRVVDLLEERYAEFPGLNLMFETREGILKHCSRKNAVDLDELGKRFLEGTQPSLEAQTANLADEIAYNNHDVDDGLRAGLLDIGQLSNCALFREQYDFVTAQWPALPKRRMISELIRRMINSLVSDVVDTSMLKITSSNLLNIEDVRNAGDSLIILSDEMQKKHKELKVFLRKNMYKHYHVQRMSYKAKKVVTTLFDSFMNHPELLQHEIQSQFEKESKKTGRKFRARIIADYIAGMTDRYAIAEFNRITDPMMNVYQ